MPTASNRFSMVPKLSSAARMPLPGATSSRAVFTSCSTSTCSPPFSLLGANTNEGPRTVARGPSQLWCFGKAPLGPYKLALLRGLLLRGLLRLLLAALAVHFLALSPGLLLHLVLPVGVAHGLRLLSC